MVAGERPLLRHLQKKQEGQGVELQAAQPQFDPWESQAASPLHNPFIHLKVKKADGNCPQGFNQEAGLKTSFSSSSLNYYMILWFCD